MLRLQSQDTESQSPGATRVYASINDLRSNLFIYDMENIVPIETARSQISVRLSDGGSIKPSPASN
jgi:hypothetical protein